MIYLEYTVRRDGVPPEDFQRRMPAAQRGWADRYGDTLLWNAGRTWRIGPRAGYITAWASERGLARMAEWEAIFDSGEASDLAAEFDAVAEIEQAGCYESLLPDPQPITGSLYFVEFFDPGGADDDAIRTDFERRNAEVVEADVRLVLRALPGLAPQPGGVSVWTVRSHATVLDIARTHSPFAAANAPTTGALYADVGREVL